ncbi:glycosyl transferase family 2 [Palleronia aestuarii]|uniref:Glycosyl transferase family 2 n=2 Tax=Palleronia aestuarii TaxID=568105 RepID=A0A2W7NGF1_9RHOB|nr:glycosyl transferase family 2 [Palleronia aestuarii]
MVLDNGPQAMPETRRLGTICVPEGLDRPPLVSIVVTNYNYATFLRTCLNSIVRQRYPSLECIIVDDASSDGSVGIIRDFLAEIDPAFPFRLVALPKNGGQMNAFHEGFSESKGVFVVFVDADDCLFEDFVWTHVRAHLSRDCTAAMTCSDAVVVDGGGQIIAGLRRGRAADPGTRARLSDTMPVECRLVAGWQETWRIEDDSMTVTEPPAPLRYVPPAANFERDWIWTSTSAVMFRRNALDIVMSDRTKGLRISADFYLFQFCHLIGGTVLVPGAHGAYRRHGANNFARDVTLSHLTVTGSGTGSGKGFGEMWDLIRAEVVANGDFLHALLGRLPFIGLLTILYPLREYRTARRALGGKSRANGVILFAQMFRRQVHVARRRLGRIFG